MLQEPPYDRSLPQRPHTQSKNWKVAPDRVLAVAENAQFWPEVLAAKASLDRGDIGELLTVRVKAWESATGEWAIDYAEGVRACLYPELSAATARRLNLMHTRLAGVAV